MKTIGVASRAIALALCLALGLPGPAGASPELSRRALRVQAGLESDTGPELERELNPTHATTAGMEESGNVLTLENVERAASWRDLFGNDQPVVLEIGIGNGQTFLLRSRADRRRNFLGNDAPWSEWLDDGNLPLADFPDNAKYIRADIRQLAEIVGRKGWTFQEIYVDFPSLNQPAEGVYSSYVFNPPEFLPRLLSLLEPGGTFFMYTQSGKVLDAVEEAVGKTGLAGGVIETRPFGKDTTSWLEDLGASDNADRFRRDGVTIYKMTWRRPAAGVEERGVPGSYSWEDDEPEVLEKAADQTLSLYQLPTKLKEWLIDFLKGHIRLDKGDSYLWEDAYIWGDIQREVKSPLIPSRRGARKALIHAWISARYRLFGTGSEGVFQFLRHQADDKSVLKQIRSERPELDAEAVLQELKVLDGIQAIRLFDPGRVDSRHLRGLSEMIRRWRPWIAIHDLFGLAPPSDIPGLEFEPDALILVNTGQAIERGMAPEQLQILPQGYPGVLEARIPDLATAKEEDILALLNRLDEQFRAGLEEWSMEDVLAILEEALQGGPGTLVIEADVISQRIGLSEFVARVPKRLGQRIVLFGEGSLQAEEVAARNEITLVNSDRLSDLAFQLMVLGDEADRVGFLGDAAVATALSEMLPQSMALIPLDPETNLDRLLLFLKYPQPVLDGINASGLEEQFARSRAA